MLRIGENTGALDRALLNVSYFYNREVREAIGKLQAMIEPALTVVLGALLGVLSGVAAALVWYVAAALVACRAL